MLNGYISRLRKTKDDLLAKVGEYDTAIRIAEMEARLVRSAAPSRKGKTPRRGNGNGHVESVKMTVKQFVANTADLKATPHAAEASRILTLAQAAGIKTTRGSISQAMIGLRKAQSASS